MDQKIDLKICVLNMNYGEKLMNLYIYKKMIFFNSYRY